MSYTYTPPTSNRNNLEPPDFIEFLAQIFNTYFLFIDEENALLSDSDLVEAAVNETLESEREDRDELKAKVEALQTQVDELIAESEIWLI